MKRNPIYVVAALHLRELVTVVGVAFLQLQDRTLKGSQ